MKQQRKPPDTLSTSGGVGGRGPRGPLLPDWDRHRRESQRRKTAAHCTRCLGGLPEGLTYPPAGESCSGRCCNGYDQKNRSAPYCKGSHQSASHPPSSGDNYYQATVAKKGVGFKPSPLASSPSYSTSAHQRLGLGFRLGCGGALSTFLTASSSTLKSILGLSIIAFLRHWQPRLFQDVVHLVGSSPNML